MGYTEPFLASIYAALDSSANAPPTLVREDFRLRTEGYKIEIDYIHDASIRFRSLGDPPLSVRSQKDCRVTYSPGSSRGDASFEAYDVMLPKLIGEWVQTVRTVLAARPTFRAAEDLARRQDQLEERLKAVPDTYATKDELERLRMFIQEIEERLAAAERAGAATQEEADQRETALRAEMEALRQRLDVPMTTRSTLRLVFTRLWKYARDPKAAQEIATLVENLKALSQSFGA